MKFDPDDPRLTAYVLGELDDRERAEVEALLQESPDARKAVEEIRSTVWVLRDELQKESTPELAPEQRERVLDRAEDRVIPLRRRWLSNWRVWGLAASVLIVAGVGLLHTGVGDLLSTARFSDQTKESVTWREFVHEQSPGIPYDATNDTTSMGDIVAVGPGAYRKIDPAAANVPTYLMDVDTGTPAASRGGLDKPDLGGGIKVSPSDNLVDIYGVDNTGWSLYEAGDGTPADAANRTAIAKYSTFAMGTPSLSARQGIYLDNTWELAAVDAYAGTHPSSSPVIEYDGSNGTTSWGDVLRVGEGSVPSAVAAYEKRDHLRALGYLEASPPSAVSKHSEFSLGTPSTEPYSPYDSSDGRSEGRNFYVMPLKNRSAAEVKSQLDRVTGRVRDVGVGTTGGYDIERQLPVRAQIVEDPATNSLIIRAEDPATMDEIQAVVELLDKPLEYTTTHPFDPFSGIDNDGDGLIDEVRDGEGNVVTLELVSPTPAPEQLNGNEDYDRIYENPFLRAVDSPLSTFSIDVDTASYANVRRFLNEGRLPPPDAVRIEEMINYFTYAYEPPTGEHPFAVHVEVAGCPWDLDHRLVRVGLKGREVPQEDRPPSNLVFLLDVSGSMNEPNKLPLLQKSMKMLVEHLTANDRVAIVVYAGASGLVLPSTSCEDKQPILDALGRLKAGGSTAGSAGIQLAYEIAADNFIKDGINRVILCTDGDFNVGITDQGQLIRLIEEKAKTGVFLSVLGFGTGNLKDSTMEQLADKGNGNYAYIDSLKEGEKVLVEQMGGTLVTIAKDVKIQIEFNPARISAYRLIGYENRMLKKEDFNDDTKDAGEIGAGHTVTALYELIPSNLPDDVDIPDVDRLKYQKRPGLTKAAGSLEILNLKLRYKEPDEDVSKLIEQPVRDSFAEYSQATDDLKFAASVAAFGMILRGSEYSGNATLEMIEELGGEGKGTDAKGYRAEFLGLVRKAKELKN